MAVRSPQQKKRLTWLKPNLGPFKIPSEHLSTNPNSPVFGQSLPELLPFFPPTISTLALLTSGT